MRQALLAARFVVYGYRTNDSFDCAGHSFGNTFRNEDVSHADRTLTSVDEPHAAAADERVPWSQLIAYGMGGVIPIALFNIAGQLMSLLGNISLGLQPFVLGAIMVVPRLWEALSDPIIGHVSDNTRTRWGRRRPFIVVGGLLVALSFVAMWWVPYGEWIRGFFSSEASYNWFQLAYILGGLLIFFTACAVFEIPHGALGLEMSADPHERTRLFSAKSFLGNLFAMGTPWLIALANLEFFRGIGGNLVDGMRYVSIFISAVLAPMTIWWFVSLREPGFAVARGQKKTRFWHDMRTTVSNKTFLILTGTVFSLAMGFNFVQIFANYITIFYLYGGNVTPASLLLGINGTVWAVTALVAVFPLNWLSKKYGKRNALLIAILLMCAAQLSKIFCYRPGVLFQFDLPAALASADKRTFTVQGPYLVLLPTMLLSAGMLMFFTLGSSMVGDVCDEDELATGTRSEGTYYSVFWWFIKMGTALASAVMGGLLVFTAFDERQNVTVDALNGDIAVMKAEAEKWQQEGIKTDSHIAKIGSQLDKAKNDADKLRRHFDERLQSHGDQADHLHGLIERTELVRSELDRIREKIRNEAPVPAELVGQSDQLLVATTFLKQQTPRSLFRLRLFDIGVPLMLSVASIVLLLRYPLTEARSYEIKEALKRRRAELAAANA
jgi:glycoside/pentoside/hexuronide:cation symporter, GPH family